MKKIYKKDEKIGDRLLLLIKQSFGTQTEFAEKMGKSVQAINRIVTTNKCSIEFINELVELLPELDLNWLIKGEGEHKEEKEKMIPNICKYDLDGEMMYLIKSQQRTIEYLSETINFTTQVSKQMEIKK